jgi:hypothetical protein
MWIRVLEGLYAATPPLELVKLLIMRAAMMSKSGNCRKVMFIDIGKAHLYAPIEGDEYVDLPPERYEPGKCAKLLFTLYGMRVAASNWEKEYTRTLVAVGFAPGRASACTFYHEEKDIKMVVHGDDFIIEGVEDELKWIRGVLESKYIVKMRGMIGPDRKDDKVIDILNRTVEWKEEELWYEADPRHAERMIEDMGLQGCKGGLIPGARDEKAPDDDQELDASGRTLYRSVVARANFLAQDRPDIRYSVKELCRTMAKPTRRDLRKLKKLVRYVAGKPRVVQKIPIGGAMNDELNIFVDSDYAGCHETRKSSNGGCVMWNGVCLKAWSTTQTVVALSSGEAEYYAAIKGAAEGLAIKSMSADLGVQVRIAVCTDSTACKGICNRTGIGKVKHMEVVYLWLQAKVKDGGVKMKRIEGKNNPADLMTKYLSESAILMNLHRMGFYFVEGRTGNIDNI